jgi:hypothetical protein
MDKDKLYELSKEINLEYEPGISIEIIDFFENEDIADFKLEFKDNTYYVNVKLKEYDFQIARKFFSAFVFFIEYRNSTFYICDKKIDSVNYTLLSKMKTNKGFLCEVKYY